jgi:hypothetical protein
MLYPVSELLAQKGPPLCVHQNETIREALVQMVTNDYSQLPVVDEHGNLIGIVSEQTISRTYYHLDDQVSLLDLPVEHCTEPAVTLTPDDELFEALDRLRNAYALVIVDGRLPIGILTNYDATQFFRDVSEGLLIVENIEANLRGYIDAAFTVEEREQAIENAKLVWQNGQPKDYDRLSFNDYVMVIVNKDNWPRFEAELQPRNLFRQYMQKVGEIRNQLAHFRDRLSPVQYDNLRRVLNWLEARPNPTPKPLQVSATEQVLVEEFEGTAVPVSQAVAGKYVLLHKWLVSRAEGTTSGYDVTLSFEEITDLIQEGLPPSAGEHRAWWSNDPSSGRQSNAWMRAGWKVESVDFGEKVVTFTRSDSVLYQVFFYDLLTGLQAVRPGMTRARKTAPVNYFSFSGGRTGFEFGWAINQQRQLLTTLYINPGNQETNDRVFQTLFADRAAIEAAVDSPLRWEPREGYVAAFVSAVVTENFSFTLPAEQLEQLKQRAIRMLIVLYDALHPRIKELKLD